MLFGMKGLVFLPNRKVRKNSVTATFLSDNSLKKRDFSFPGPFSRRSALESLAYRGAPARAADKKRAASRGRGSRYRDG